MSTTVAGHVFPLKLLWSMASTFWPTLKKLRAGRRLSEIWNHSNRCNHDHAGRGFLKCKSPKSSNRTLITLRNSTARWDSKSIHFSQFRDYSTDTHQQPHLRTLSTCTRRVRPFAILTLEKRKSLVDAHFYFTDLLGSDLNCPLPQKCRNVLCAVLPRWYTCGWQMSDNPTLLS